MMMDKAPVGRRQYSVEFKQRAVAESFAPGQSAAGVARRYGLNANLLFRWRRDRRLNGSTASPSLVPVEVKQTPGETFAKAPPSPVSPGSGIEIELVSGDKVRFCEALTEEALYRVVSVLRRFA